MLTCGFEWICSDFSNPVLMDFPLISEFGTSGISTKNLYVDVCLRDNRDAEGFSMPQTYRPYEWMILCMSVLVQALKINVICFLSSQSTLNYIEISEIFCMFVKGKEAKTHMYAIQNPF